MKKRSVWTRHRPTFERDLYIYCFKLNWFPELRNLVKLIVRKKSRNFKGIQWITQIIWFLLLFGAPLDFFLMLSMLGHPATSFYWSHYPVNVKRTVVLQPPFFIEELARFYSLSLIIFKFHLSLLPCYYYAWVCLQNHSRVCFSVPLGLRSRLGQVEKNWHELESFLFVS